MGSAPRSAAPTTVTATMAPPVDRSKTARTTFAPQLSAPAETIAQMVPMALHPRSAKRTNARMLTAEATPTAHLLLMDGHSDATPPFALQLNVSAKRTAATPVSCDNNVCTFYQCLGHLSCESDFPGKCADGKCKCESRQCVEKECTKHSHCPNGGLCDNNPKTNPTFECYNEHDDGSKTCRSHAQCGPKSKCEDKKCVAVECRTNVDCKGKEGKDTWRCHDENSSEELQNTCYAVGCNKHDQCGAKKVCIDNVCE